MKKRILWAHRRLGTAEERVCACKEMSTETFNAEVQNEKRIKKVGWTIQELWNNCNRYNVCVT